MTQPDDSEARAESIRRLKRVEGHLRHVIDMLHDDRPYLDVTTQLQAVEKAISAAKRTMIHDHIDRAVGDVELDSLSDIRAMTKLL